MLSQDDERVVLFHRLTSSSSACPNSADCRRDTVAAYATRAAPMYAGTAHTASLSVSFSYTTTTTRISRCQAFLCALFNHSVYMQALCLTCLCVVRPAMPAAMIRRYRFAPADEAAAALRHPHLPAALTGDQEGSKFILDEFWHRVP